MFLVLPLSGCMFIIDVGLGLFCFFVCVLFLFEVMCFFFRLKLTFLLFQAFLIKERNIIAPYKTVRVSMHFFTVFSELMFCKDLCSHFGKSKVIISWGIWQESLKNCTHWIKKQCLNSSTMYLYYLLEYILQTLLPLLCSSVGWTIRQSCQLATGI